MIVSSSISPLLNIFLVIFTHSGSSEITVRKQRNKPYVVNHLEDLCPDLLSTIHTRTHENRWSTWTDTHTPSDKHAPSVTSVCWWLLWLVQWCDEESLPTLPHGFCFRKPVALCQHVSLCACYFSRRALNNVFYSVLNLAHKGWLRQCAHTWCMVLMYVVSI